MKCLNWSLLVWCDRVIHSLSGWVIFTCLPGFPCVGLRFQPFYLSIRGTPILPDVRDFFAISTPSHGRPYRSWARVVSCFLFLSRVSSLAVCFFPESRASPPPFPRGPLEVPRPDYSCPVPTARSNDPPGFSRPSSISFFLPTRPTLLVFFFSAFSLRDLFPRRGLR